MLLPSETPSQNRSVARRARAGRRRSWLVVAVCGVLALAAVMGLIRGTTTRPGTTRRPAGHHATAPLVVHPVAPPYGRAQAQVTISQDAALTPISAEFLGISTEYWTLPVDERHVVLYSRVLSLMHVPGGDPLVLRIGGDSSDRTFWDPTAREMPQWAFRLTPEWIERTARLVRSNHLRVIIDLNFVTGTPALAAQWARRAESEFPPNSIVGFEIGNEPDLYDRMLWTVNLGGSKASFGALPKAITPSSYALAYLTYAKALATAAPQVPLLAPALAEPGDYRVWISTLLAGLHPRLGAISVHEYPYTACALPTNSKYPTVAKLLSAPESAQIGAGLAPARRLAHEASLPLRVTEFNSITCGGLTGVSNTFATALWAPDALFEMARAGVSGAALHARIFSINAPFAFHGNGIFARPLLYGLILFSRMLGADSRMVALDVQARRGDGLKAWAVAQGQRRLNVLLINKGSRSLGVEIRLPVADSAPATVQRLLAPSAHSTDSVTLAGQRLTAAATWTGNRVVERVLPQSGSYTVAVRAHSAAMVTIRIPPQMLPATTPHTPTLSSAGSPTS